ncbi:ribbon-helix-helix domain-containing protein [Mycobacterium sp.]|uniref:ribbon-helix-helix domain-containing protein n=1 Tax=Mycobacterium sp. TaxID=1785 RepID=UPI00127AAB42|nr:ribbon-helix-helix domain-containing protein [Mycobacterium sp.]KAA8939175.1 MAG: CopG family transcriptional regulator [Mycobacterium sp.]
MISFRVDDADAAAIERWARALHIDRSELIRDALRRHLAQLAADQDVAAYAEQPVTDEERALAEIADWGPAEDWADWADAAR